MLLDPLEEQLHLPALAVQGRDQLREQDEVVGQNGEPFPVDVGDHDATQRRRMLFARRVHRQHTGLIAEHVGGGSIHGVRVSSLELGVGLGTRHEKTWD